jgi:hypothetical protein
VVVGAGWTLQPGSRLEVWVSTINDRAFAEAAGETGGLRFVHLLPLGGTRYYWARVRRDDGQVSEFYPASSTAGIEGEAYILSDTLAPPIAAGPDGWIEAGAVWQPLDLTYRFGALTGGAASPEYFYLGADPDDALEVEEEVFPLLLSFGYTSGNESIAALSFPEFSLMEGQAIASATLRIFIITTNETSGSITVEAQKALEQERPSDTNLPSDWTPTTATATFTAEEGEILIDVTDIIEEIVAQEGWQHGRLNFRITPPPSWDAGTKLATLAAFPSPDAASLAVNTIRVSGTLIGQRRRGPVVYDIVASPLGNDIFDLLMEVRRDEEVRISSILSVVVVETADGVSQVFIEEITSNLRDANISTEWRELQIRVPVIANPLGATEPRPHYIRFGLTMSLTEGGYVYVRRLHASRRENALTLFELPVFEDDDAAASSGLVAGQMYRTADGALRIKL